MDPQTTMNDDVLSEAGLLIENDKATEQMKNSISQFARLLVCPLCSKVCVVLRVMMLFYFMLCYVILYSFAVMKRNS
jgi:hypothetical protein